MSDDPMSDEGPFLSFLSWLDRPGQAVRNSLRGEFGSAGRQLLDFFGEIPDALLPGNIIPDATRKEDYISGSELVGLDEDTPWYLKLPTDIGVGIATDPLSLLGVGAVANTARGGLSVGVPFVRSMQKTFDLGMDIDPIRNAGRLYDALTPQPVQDALAPVGRGIRSMIGAEKLTPEAEALRLKSRVAGENVARAGSEAIREAFKDATPEERALMFRVIRNVTQSDGGEWDELLAESDPRAAIYDIAKQSDELTPWAGDADIVSPPDAMKQVSFRSRGPIPLEERMLGIKGVDAGAAGEVPATPPLFGGGILSPLLGGDLDPLYRGAGISASVTDAKSVREAAAAQWADEAAGRALDAAHPLLPNPRFASGIDLANRDYGFGPEQIRTVGEVFPSPTLEPSGIGGDAARALVDAGLPNPVLSATARDPLTGAPVTVQPRPSVELPNATDRLNEMLGGPAAEVTRQAAMSAPDTKALFDTVENQLKRWSARVDAMGLPPERSARLKDLLGRYLTHSQTQFKEAVQDFPAFFRPQGIDIEREVPADYLMGIYDVPKGELEMAGDLALPSTLKEKTLRRGADLAKYLNESGAKPIEDALELAVKRASQQGRLATKSTLGSELIEQTAKLAKQKQVAGEALSEAEQAALDARYTALASEGFNKATNAILEEVAKRSPEDAQVLKDLYSGLPGRSKPMQALATLNRYFKPYAVFGLAVPKIGSLVRNRTSAIGQVMATDGAESAIGAMANPVNVLREVTAAVMDGIGLAERAPGKVFDDVRQIDDAFKNSGGRASNVAKSLREAGRDDLAAAVEHGVLDSFVASEKLISEVGSTGAKKWLQNVLDAPAKMFQSVEHQMRLGVFQRLLESGKSADEAAKLTRSALYDYGVNSLANRRMRDFVPFAQFMAKSMPQQAAWMARTPAAGVAAAQVFGQDPNEPVYPYLSEKAGFATGRNEDGTLNYVGGLGLPMESLGIVPDFEGGLLGLGQDLRKGVVSSGHPMLKSAFAAVSGEDPYFGTDAFSYSKIPGIGDAGAIGRGYNAMVGAGLMPVAPLMQQAEAIRKAGVGEWGWDDAALDLLTGANVVRVDQDRAMRQIVQGALERNGDVKTYESMYSESDDPEAQALLEQYNDLKKKLREKRERAKSTGVI